MQPAHPRHFPLADPDQFPPIPFPAKALKILLSDAQNAAADGVGNKLDASDADSDDGVRLPPHSVTYTKRSADTSPRAGRRMG